MKVLNLSHSVRGGAGRAVYRLHQALRLADLQSFLLTSDLEHPDPSVLVSQNKLRRVCNDLKIPERLDHLSISFSTQAKPAFFAANSVPDFLQKRIAELDPDIINLHWISKGLLKIETLGKLNRPLLWTLHDMWPFTGGCFYSESCDRYTQACGQCPQLHSNRERDLSRQIWERKARALRGVDLTVVAPSQWLANCAQKSRLFQDVPIKTIPHGLDTTRYQPIDQREARKALNLPPDQQLVLFGAVNSTSDRRKGFQLLGAALHRLYEAGNHDNLELVVFGSTAPKQPIDFGFKANYLGYFSDDVALSMVYSAADVMIVPSLQEAFGQTASEALACGTPVVGFDRTGVAEIVVHKKTGYLATPFEVEDLAYGIAWVLKDQARRITLREQSRHRAEQEFSLAVQSQRYVELFHQILKYPPKTAV